MSMRGRCVVERADEIRPREHLVGARVRERIEHRG